MLTKRRIQMTFTSLAVLIGLILSLLGPVQDSRSAKQSLDADQITGVVTSVADGDTLTLVVDGERVKVRLQGIDSPEQNQPRGREAGDYLRGEVMGREVVVRTFGKDRYKRVLGEVSLDGRNLNEEMLEKGLAWWYEQYAADRTDYRDLEREAREARRGLWGDPNPIPPWEHRARSRR